MMVFRVSDARLQVRFQVTLSGRCDKSNQADCSLTNLAGATRRLHARDLATNRRPGLCSLGFRSTTRPGSGIRQNRFLFADNSDMAPASILCHGTG